MSLVAVVRTNHGIVMSADKRLAMDFIDKTQDGQKIVRRRVISDHEQKLFQIGDWGLSYFGDNVGEPMSVTIKRFVKNLNPKIGMMECARSLLTTVCNKSEEPFQAFFYLCGYENTDNPCGTILMLEAKDNKITPISANKSIVMGGDLNKLTESFINIPSDWVTYNVGNAMEYLRFLTYAASCYQRFSCCAETISTACNFLVIPQP